MVRGKQGNNPNISSDSVISGHLDEWVESAIDFIDGHLDNALSTAIQAHLNECPECAARLAVQRDFLALVAGSPLVEPPADLESRVLNEALQAVRSTQPRSIFSRSRSTKRSTRKPRRLPAGPWLPATAGAAAVVALVLALTISNQPGTLDETMTTMAAVFASEAGTAQTIRDGGADQSDAVAVSLANSDDADTASEDSSDLTSVAGLTSFASLQPVGPYLEEENDMAIGLAQTNTPAYFFFDTSDGTPITTEQADEITARLTSATGLQLMDESLSSGVKAFAAFVPRDDSSAVVHLLYTIGDSLELSCCLSLTPGDGVTNWADGMIKDQYSLAELSAIPVTPSGWDYTTSTATPTTEESASTTLITSSTTTSTVLDKSSTHVLVVIFMATQETQ